MQHSLFQHIESSDFGSPQLRRSLHLWIEVINQPYFTLILTCWLFLLNSFSGALCLTASPSATTERRGETKMNGQTYIKLSFKHITLVIQSTPTRLCPWKRLNSKLCVYAQFARFESHLNGNKNETKKMWLTCPCSLLEPELNHGLLETKLWYWGWIFTKT